MNQLTLHLIIILVSILSFFLAVFAFLFWHFKFRQNRSDSLTAPPSTIRSRSADPKFQARLDHYNTSLSSKQSEPKSLREDFNSKEEEEVEVEFGRVSGNVKVDTMDGGLLNSISKRESNGTRSYFGGWFGLDAGTGAGYNNTISSSRSSQTLRNPPSVESNLSRSLSLSSRPVQPPTFLGGVPPTERDLETGPEEVEMSEERKGLTAHEEKMTTREVGMGDEKTRRGSDEEWEKVN